MTRLCIFQSAFVCQCFLPGSYKHRIKFWWFKALFPSVTASTLNIILVQLHWLRKKMKFLITAVVLEQRLWIKQALLENSLTVSTVFYLRIIGRSSNNVCRHACTSLMWSVRLLLSFSAGCINSSTSWTFTGEMLPQWSLSF